MYEGIVYYSSCLSVWPCLCRQLQAQACLIECISGVFQSAAVQVYVFRSVNNYKYSGLKC